MNQTVPFYLRHTNAHRKQLERRIAMPEGRILTKRYALQLIYTPSTECNLYSASCRAKRNPEISGLREWRMLYMFR